MWLQDSCCQPLGTGIVVVNVANSPSGSGATPLLFGPKTNRMYKGGESRGMKGTRDTGEYRGSLKGHVLQMVLLH